jgi:hypothetical protein
MELSAIAISAVTLKFGPSLYRLYFSQNPQVLVDSMGLTLRGVKQGLKTLIEKRNKQDINDSVVSGKVSNDVSRLDELQKEYDAYA